MSFHKVLEVMKDSPQYRDRRKVRSGNSGEEYTVSIRKRDNRWACSCKGWIFKYQKLDGDAGNCGHIREIKETYSDKSKSNGIILKVTEFATQVKASRDGIKLLDKWAEIKDSAEMLLFYFQNTPDKGTQAAQLSAQLAGIRADLKVIV